MVSSNQPKGSQVTKPTNSQKSSKTRKKQIDSISITMQDPFSNALMMDTFQLFSGRSDPFADIADGEIWEAQEVAYKAWETDSKKEQIEFAQKALAISKDCAEAYVILSWHAKTPEEALDLCEQGVAAGERALGKELIEEYKGMFWGILETRPYMRAKAELALKLWEANRFSEAIQQYQDLLELNPNDNQGMRSCLLACLLEQKQIQAALALWKQYKNDGSADWHYGRVLALFQKEGASAKTKQALKSAQKENPHIPAYLLNRKQMPKTLPDTYTWGSKEEGILYKDLFGAAWEKTEGALMWLQEAAPQHE